MTLQSPFCSDYVLEDIEPTGISFENTQDASTPERPDQRSIRLTVNNGIAEIYTRQEADILRYSGEQALLTAERFTQAEMLDRFPLTGRNLFDSLADWVWNAYSILKRLDYPFNSFQVDCVPQFGWNAYVRSFELYRSTDNDYAFSTGNRWPDISGVSVLDAPMTEAEAWGETSWGDGSASCQKMKRLVTNHDSADGDPTPFSTGTFE